MPRPSNQHIAICNDAARTAQATSKAILDLQAYLTRVAFSPSVKSIADADFNDKTTPGPLTGFDAKTLTEFNDAATKIIELIHADDMKLGKAISAMAERSS